MAQIRLMWLALALCAISSISNPHIVANGEELAEQENRARDLTGELENLLDEFGKAVEDGLDELAEQLKDKIEEKAKELSKLLALLPPDVACELRQSLRKAVEGARMIIEAARDAAKTIWSWIWGALEAIVEVFCDCLDFVIDKISGASPKTATANGLGYSGKKASRALAEADLEKIEAHRECFDRVGAEYMVSSYVLAGLVSRMTRGGTAIENTDGYSSDNTKYGVLPCDVTASGLGEDCKGFRWNTCDHVEMVVKRVLRPKMDEIMTDDNTKDLDYYDQLKMSLEVFNYYGEEDFTNDVLGRSMFYCNPTNITGEKDPHFFVPVHGSENPVCFDLYGETGQIFQLLEDKDTGAVINAELTNGNVNFADGKWMGKMTVLKDGHSVYLDSDGITVDNATKGTWEQNISLAPMAMTMDQSTVNIFDLGDFVTASVRTNAFGALDIDILIKESSKTTNIGGLVGVAIDCLESVEVEDENEAILNLCGDRKVRSDLALRRQGKTPCWLVPFDTLFDGKDFMPPCLFCAMPKGKGKGNQ